ncbi:hypothetical protein EYC80_007298 [Monilinia laxa]|uniref:laccase n=1 Tax=Monilinia laxa TaxID=61186 RepID=A0A5N6JUV9_MONLA|nr:hypothetical protein EYC80_007298 [Monilinia laxa]
MKILNILVLSSLAIGAILPGQIDERDGLNKRQASTSTTTGSSVYNLEFTNTTCAPDGVTRSECMLINGQFPGPTLYADWGDMIQVTVKNSLQHNGTGIHWHGIRQYHTCTEDGVPGITECPLAPGDTKVYTFQATQHGTTWYHSHFSGQYGEGIIGGLVINGPASANYDIDLGTYMVQDWYHTPVFALGERVAHSQAGPPPGDNALINGSMVAPTGQTGGKYTTNTISTGRKYRLRLINTSVDNHFMVSLDGHPFTVITSDFVAIHPYTTNWIFLGIGQRYDVIITANQTVGSYWFRAEVQAGCGSNTNNGNIKSIFTYSGANSTTPASTAIPYTGRCTDETGLIPFWDSFVPSGPLSGNVDQLNVAIDIGVTADGPIVTWGINLTALDVDWKKPILQYVLDGNNSWPVSENLISLNNAGEWYYWIIQEVPGTNNGNPVSVNVPHPIHLHGHDFYILGTGVGTYNNTINGPNLDYDNPTRRDVAMLPAGGWLVLAFQTDNPGAWLMHCHIGWHASGGLAVQFLESQNQINSINPISPALTNTCNKWNAWYPSQAPYVKTDSGI